MIEVAVTPREQQNRSEPGASTWPHVLLLIDQLDRTLGGGERILLQIAEHLPRYRFRVSILTFSLHPDSPALSRPPCPIYVLPVQRVISLRGLRGSLALSRFLKSENIQIVHSFFASADLWGGFVARALSRSKLVWSLRDMGFQRNRQQRLGYRLMSGFPDAVFAVSERVRKQAIDVDRIPPGRILTIYNGLSTAEWDHPSRAPRRADRFHITTVGNLRRVKGHDIFVEAAAQVRLLFPNATFSIVGDVLEPDFELELRGRVEELDLQNNLRFLPGSINLPEHLAQCDLFVLASRSEGFPNVLIEAMASSLPVVATDVGGNAEAVVNGESGLIVPSEAVGALVDAIVWIVSRPDRAQAMGASGRNLVIEKFTTSQMMTRIAGAYRSLLSEAEP